MSMQPLDSHLLPFEEERFHGTYRLFYADKRGAFFNTVQAFPEIWDAFELLDEIWIRELEDLRVPGSPAHVLPTLLAYSAHREIRMAFELGFSHCLPEACTVMRNGIESVACGYNLLGKPQLLTQVMSPQKSEKAQLRVFRNVLAKARKDLSDKAGGLQVLHTLWIQFSNYGAHSTLMSLATQLKGSKSATANEIRFTYLDVDKTFARASLCNLLGCAFEMERVFFRGFKNRLELDDTLGSMRARFYRKWNAVFRDLTAAAGLAKTAERFTS